MSSPLEGRLGEAKLYATHECAQSLAISARRIADTLEEMQHDLANALERITQYARDEAERGQHP